MTVLVRVRILFLVTAMLLRFLTLNVQGFKSRNKQEEVLRLARSVQCDFLFVQETNFTSSSDIMCFEAHNHVKGFFPSVSSALKASV